MSPLYYITTTHKSIPAEILKSIDALPVTGNSYAAFDMDNTLLVGDIAEAVFALMVKKKLIQDFGWRDYLAHIEKNRLWAYKHIIDLMLGMKLSLLKEVTEEVINRRKPIALEGYTLRIPKPHHAMKRILELLEKKGIAIYVVTASNEISAKIICKKYFNIPASHIIGAEVARNKNGIIQVGTKEFPYHKGKVNILKKRFKNKPLVTGGDSPGDKYLLDYTAKSGLRLWLGKQGKNSGT